MQFPPDPGAGWWSLDGDGTLLLQLYIQPGARRTESAGLHDGCLKLRVQAPPREGSANAALTEWLARRLGVAKSAVSIRRGHASRRKLVAVRQPACGPEQLL